MSLAIPKTYGNVQDAASAILNASPAYISVAGLSTCAAAGYAIWFSGSSIASGSILFHLTASPQSSLAVTFPVGLWAACQLGCAASGAGASALTVWFKDRGA